MSLDRFGWLIALIAVIWAVQVVNLLTGYTLNDWFGLRPRSLGGLDGVVLMPLLHGSFAHILSNSVPLVVLGGLMAATAPRNAIPATAIIIVLGGIAVWLLGKTAIHVGASGLIFGWFGYLVARGVVERRLVPILVAAGVALFYGTMIFGVLPGQPGVSWESHLFGAGAGVSAALLLRN